MKSTTKTALIVAFVVAICASFFLGSYIKQNEISDNRLQQCNTYISFAISKAETQDLSDQGVIKALISNIYAAYAFCDNSNISGQLHDLWNELIFNADSYLEKDDILVTRLKGISDSLKIDN